MNKKAAIEFSVNVIVIIVISSVILALGLMLFFNLKSQATKYTDSIEQQTAEQLKALMLNDNSRVAVYPNDLTIQPGKSQMTTVGVTNSLGVNNQIFFTKNANYFGVTYYSSPTATGVTPSLPTNPPWNGTAANVIIVSQSGGGSSHMDFGTIISGEQNFKNILIKPPKNALKGQYVININVYNKTGGGNCDILGNPCPEPYGLVKLYITVP